MENLSFIRRSFSSRSPWGVHVIYVIPCQFTGENHPVRISPLYPHCISSMILELLLKSILIPNALGPKIPWLRNVWWLAVSSCGQNPAPGGKQWLHEVTMKHSKQWHYIGQTWTNHLPTGAGVLPSAGCKFIPTYLNHPYHIHTYMD